ncbi:MAG: GWxTD domain-containing protein [Gemmatimonadaceae bacterium]|nr:GWxTD domain-containing protein [Gemmatimonadota bacterium]
MRTVNTRVEPSAWRLTARAGLCLAAVVVAAGCAGARPPVGSGPAGPAPNPGGPGAAAMPGTASDMQRLYRSMGLIAGSGAIPFAASVSFLRAPSADSTLMLVALSIPSRSLGFAREGDRYAASYTARLELRQGAAIVRSVQATEAVRVPTFRETARTDESVIWQQYLRLAPGRYAMTVSVKDESSIRGATEEVSVEVPRLPGNGLSSPIPVYEAIPRVAIDSLPRLLARPRATVVFGQDSVLPVYLDALGASAPGRVHVRVIGDGDITLWDSTSDLAARGTSRSTTVPIPVTRLGVGINTVQFSVPGQPDTVRTRVLVSLGDDLPIASFDEMLTYLRWFTSPDRLAKLKAAAPADRATTWAGFLRETDPVPGTAEHEGLRDYFARIRVANVRFRDDAQVGWQSDRGTAYVALGDPDNIIDTGMIDPNARVRQQIWEYRELRIQLNFVDQTGFGRWRLNTQGRADLDAAIRRKLALQQR